LEATREELASAHEEFDVAPVVLDAALRIQRFTPAATRLFHLLPADAGRALADLTPQFHDPRLLDDARAVLREAPPSGSEGRRRRRFLVGAPHLALPHPG
jgi:two-component system CheB/CheR fusion protein